MQLDLMRELSNDTELYTKNLEKEITDYCEDFDIVISIAYLAFNIK